MNETKKIHHEKILILFSSVAIYRNLGLLFAIMIT